VLPHLRIFDIIKIRIARIFKQVRGPWNTGATVGSEDMPRKPLTASEPLKSWVDLGAAHFAYHLSLN
jgi:hypothetical protein